MPFKRYFAGEKGKLGREHYKLRLGSGLLSLRTVEEKGYIIAAGKKVNKDSNMNVILLGWTWNVVARR